VSNYIPLADCINGAVYRIRSRNLAIGVFVQAANGFIGIRTKFSSRYLFTEYHYDTGAPCGTVMPIEKLDIKVPEGVLLVQTLGSVGKYITENEDLFKFLDALK